MIRESQSRRQNSAITILLFAWLIARCIPCDYSDARAAQMPASASRLPGEIVLSDGWQLQNAAKVPDQGQAVSQPDYIPDSWLKATVPGTVLTSLVNDGIYPEPLYGENNRPNIIPDSLCRTSYWYRTQFQVPAEFSGSHIWLNFHGINYIAEVWINGHDVGSIKGAFIRGTFDVTPFVAPDKQAALAVQIFPPPNPGVPHEHTALAGMVKNGGILTGDGPTFLCAEGWDWIPGIRDRDIGIWQKVTLSASGPVILENPAISCELPLPRIDSADLTLITTIHNLSAHPQSGTLHAHFAHASLPGFDFDVPVTLAPAEVRLIKLTPAQIPELHLQSPQLWWPSGYGQPNLYTLQLSFNINGANSDVKIFNFGIRKITYTVPTSDNLTLSVNGVPILCKGGDWGMDEAMKRIPRARLEAQIRYHQLANYNMIRNWVGQSTSEDFYDLCDQYGILVWDEFFQPRRGPDPSDIGMYLANVRDKILRFRSHPCIAIWCGRNESDPSPQAVDVGDQKIAAELDPTRLYHRNSSAGNGVHSGGPYLWRPPRDYYTFTEAFKTEIGSVSIPTIESIHAMMPQRDWETVNDDWAEHDLGHGAQEGAGGKNRPPLYPDLIAARFGPVANLPDFVRKAQLANYEAFRAMYEGRNAKLFTPCTGVLTWMSNPAQPSFVWQIYAHDLEPLSSLFAAKKACEPVHIQMNQNNFHLMVINNTPATLNKLIARVRIFNLDGAMKSDYTLPLTAPPCCTTDLGSINWPAALSPVHFVRLDLQTADHHPVSDNFYWRALPDREDDFAPLQSMPAAPLTANITHHDQPGKCFFDVTLFNPGPAIALMAHLQLRKLSTGERILPVYYSDNYVTLVPGESRTISVEAAADDLAGDQPAFALDGWNITTTPQSLKDVSIALNRDAQIDSVPTGTWKVIHPK